jgi:glycosyltransferase involved in cell wall biosynthesis
VNIGVIGAFGLPARHGGIERHAEEIYTRLVEHRHNVTVYCRSNYSSGQGIYRGIRLKRIPVVQAKGWETFGYSVLASIHAMIQDFDLIHYHSLGPSALALLPKAVGKKVACTIHSSDWKHGKWGHIPRAALRMGEFSAMKFSDMVITVSDALKSDLDSRYRRHVPIYSIPNGVARATLWDSKGLGDFGLEPGRYILYVGRLVPEKGVHLLIDASDSLSTIQFVLVGGSRYEDGYAGSLKNRAGANVKFLDYVYGDKLAVLYSHARMIVAPSSHEGFGLAVLEGMSYGKCVLASDIPVFREVLENTGFFFNSGDAASLSGMLSWLMNNPDEMSSKGALARERAERVYQWERIAAMTEEALLSVC